MATYGLLVYNWKKLLATHKCMDNVCLLSFIFVSFFFFLRRHGGVVVIAHEFKSDDLEIKGSVVGGSLSVLYRVVLLDSNRCHHMKTTLQRS